MPSINVDMDMEHQAGLVATLLVAVSLIAVLVLGCVSKAKKEAKKLADPDEGQPLPYTFYDEDNQLARKISSSLLDAAMASAFSSIVKDEVDDGKINHVFEKAGGIEWDDSDDDEVPAPKEQPPKSGMPQMRQVLAYDPDVDDNEETPDAGEEADTEEVPEITDEMKAAAQAAKEGTAQDRAAFHMWRQDPVVTKKLRAQYDASYPEGLLSRDEVLNVVRRLAKHEWLSLTDKQYQFWAVKARTTKVAAVAAANAKAPMTHPSAKEVKAVRAKGEAWGFTLEQTPGGYAIATIKIGSPLARAGLSIGAVIDFVNYTEIGKMNLEQVTRLIELATELILSVRSSKARSPSKKWKVETQSRNETIEQKEQREKAQREKMANSETESKTTAAERARRKARAKRRAAQNARRAKRRAQGAGSSDDSTDVEPDSDGGRRTSTTPPASKVAANSPAPDAEAVPVVVKPTEAEAKLLAGDVDAFLDALEEVTLTRPDTNVSWGVLLKQTNDGLAVDTIDPGSPAAAAPQLVPGLLIAEINNTPVTGLPMSQVIALVKTPLSVTFALMESVSDITFDNGDGTFAGGSAPTGADDEESEVEDE